MLGPVVDEVADLENLDETDRKKLERLQRWHVHLLATDLLPARERALAGKTLARMIILDDRKGMALRHVNVPVLLRMGCLAVEVAHDRRTRSRAVARDWDDLATGLLW